MAEREVEGVDLDELADQYEAFEVAVLAALNATMRKAVREDAVAGTLARLSLDDLNVIPPLWMQQVPGLAEQVMDAYVTAANMQANAYVKAGGAEIPLFTSEHQSSLDYLSQATNRLVGIGDDLWADARNELLAGLDLGEDIPTISARVRKATDVTKPRATMIARTEIVGSSNAGSIAFMRATGEVAAKTWIRTQDPRCRPSHVAAGGQTVLLNEKFTVGGALMDHPGDPSGPASQTANCRCCLGYRLVGEPAEAVGDGGTLAASMAIEETPMTVTADLGPTPVDIHALVAAMDPAQTVAWAGVLCVEGERTGDHREFLNLSWGNLPMPLQWQKVSSHGGVPTDETVLIGRIDTIVKNGNEIYGTGLIDLGSADGREAARLMGTRTDPAFLSGVSIVGDDPNNGLVEVTFPTGCDGELTPADMMRCSEPEVVTYHDSRIRAATLCDVPAIMTGQLYLTSMEAPMADDPVDFGTQELVSDGFVLADVVETLTAAAATIVIPDLPPESWFTEPLELPEFGAITVTDQGQIYGLLAPANVQHRGYEKRVTVPMRNVSYATWMNRERIVETDDGGTRRIATGAITMDCSHYGTAGPLARSPRAAAEHYDHSCALFATACVGENKQGVWIAGAVLPDVTGPQIARALACQLSGDWRPSDRKGWRELAGCLLVGVPGFPVANKGARVSMQGDALVASASPMRFETNAEPAECGCGTESYADVANAARIIAMSVGRDHATRARDLYLSVKP